MRDLFREGASRTQAQPECGPRAYHIYRAGHEAPSQEHIELGDPETQVTSGPHDHAVRTYCVFNVYRTRR